jgi:hypothetical protein
MKIHTSQDDNEFGAGPATRVPVLLRIAEVAADGSARIEVNFVSADATGDSTPPAGNSRTLPDVAGLSGWYSMDSRGFIGVTTVTSYGTQSLQRGDALLRELARTMQTFAAPLPAESVGVGARWRSSMKESLSNYDVSDTAEYTLRELAGNRIILDVKFVEARLDSRTALPASAKVSSIKIQGNGTQEFALNGQAPTSRVATETILVATGTNDGETTITTRSSQSMAPAGK